MVPIFLSDVAGTLGTSLRNKEKPVLCSMETPIGTDVAQDAALLRAGAVVAMPTETVYGLAANAFDEAAVLRAVKRERSTLRASTRTRA